MVEGELETSREAIVGGMEGRSTAHRCCRRGQRETPDCAPGGWEVLPSGRATRWHAPPSYVLQGRGPKSRKGVYRIRTELVLLLESSVIWGVR